MIEDPKTLILPVFQGAMIPAGMQECLIELVERRYVDISCLYRCKYLHDICEHCGIRHYLGHHHVDDTELFEKGIDRIYDVFAFEEQFRAGDQHHRPICRPFCGGLKDHHEFY